MQGTRDSETREIFASGIRNPGLWYLEFSLRTPDSRYWIPDCTLQDCLGLPCMERHFPVRSLYVSGKLPTYPSPKLTLTHTSHLGQNVGLGEG